MYFGLSTFMMQLFGFWGVFVVIVAGLFYIKKL